MEKELLIQEKEKLYMEMKQVLQRQPGPEVAEQLHIYQQSLKEKTKQMKVHRRRPLAHDPRLATNTEHACILCSKCSNRDSKYLCMNPTCSSQSMASELNMYESQVAEYKMDIDRLQRELQEVKKKYYLQKKKEHYQK